MHQPTDRASALTRLRRDIPEALVAGAARDPQTSTTGTLWVLALALLCAGSGLALFLLGGYHAGFRTLNGLAAELPGWVWQWLTVLGDERVAFALSLVIARRHPRIFWTLVCSALVAVAYSRGLKPAIDAARPPAVLEPGTFQQLGEAYPSESFPSGHSVTAAVFFGVLVYYVRGLRWRLLLVLLIVLAGLSRVAVGIHWPVDVAAGLAGGLVAVLIGVQIARRTPWGSLNASVHLALVAIGAIVTVSLFVDDGGYPAAAPFLLAVGVIGLTSAALGYIVRPVLAASR